MKLNRFLNDEISLGKGSVKIPAADMIQQYRDRYQRMILQGKRFKFTLHYVMPGGRIIVHFKVPSETVNNFYYDVLLELNASGGAKKFEDCHIRIFSNCPSFVYTYAYVFYHLPDDELGKPNIFLDDLKEKIPQNRILVKDSEEKLPDEARTERPVVRSPYGLPLFDKSIYYAVFYLLEHLDFNRTMYNKHMATSTSLLREVEDFDTLMVKRKQQVSRDRERHKKAVASTAKTFQSKERDIASQAGIKRVKAVKSVQSNAKKISKNSSGGINKISGKSKRQ